VPWRTAVLVSVIVTNGKAYLTTEADSPVGFYAIEPVKETELTVDSLAEAIEKQKKRGNPVITDAELAKLRKGPDATLKATGKKSWRQLGHEGATYAFHWLDDHVLVSISMTDRKGRWIYDETKSQKLPLDTKSELLARTILEDVKTRPEVL
jgi:hypothetical protein